jgi:hypothetical protein
MKAERVIVKDSTEELGRFIDDLREYLGLDPIDRPHNKAKGRRTLVESDTLRFARTYPEAWHRSRTPVRNSGC